MICCAHPNCQYPQNPTENNFCLSCGKKLILIVGNRYQIIERIGRGGFGCTYLAKDIQKLNEKCVVKQFAPQFSGSEALLKAAELFKQEAQRLQELGLHPQIPTLYAYFEEGEYLYLVQQFIQGQNLLQELQQQSTFTEAKIQDLLSDLLPVVQVAHQEGIIHRDIKPENILRDVHDGKLVLIDFGIAKQTTATLTTQPETIIGTRGYAAFEQINNGKAYPASDLYSLGVTCFYLYTNIHPNQLLAKRGYSWTSDWQHYLPHPLSYELSLILNKLLQEKHQDRYQSVDEVLTDLKLLQQQNSRFAKFITVTSQNRIIQQQFTFSQSKAIWNLLPSALITSTINSLFATLFIALKIRLGLGLILLVFGLGISIFIQSRTWFEKIYLFIIALATTLFVLSISQILRIPHPWQSAWGLVIIALLVICAGLLVFTIISISQIIYRLISRFFLIT